MALDPEDEGRAQQSVPTEHAAVEWLGRNIQGGSCRFVYEQVVDSSTKADIVPL
ncbi:hypothetical protein FA13DRAFT_1730133, partial [Coprinellus micaceus]